MQKYTREKRQLKYGQLAEEFMQFRLFRIIDAAYVQRALSSGEKLMGGQLERVGNSGDYVNKREVSKRFRVPPGDYLVVPRYFL